MRNPPPPSQQQADEAQRTRHAAEMAILAVFAMTEAGGGGGEGEPSTLRGVKISAILARLSAGIVAASFRHPRDRSKSLLVGRPNHKEIGAAVLPEAQEMFDDLASSDLSDDQKAVIWATQAYSKVAGQIAESVNNGTISHLFAENGLQLKKVWISRSDSRVRSLHAKLHGKAVPSSEDFWRWPHEGGGRLRWPGDREAPLDATIGCRCVVILTWADQSGVSDTIKRIVESTR